VCVCVCVCVCKSAVNIHSLTSFAHFVRSFVSSLTAVGGSKGGSAPFLELVQLLRHQRKRPIIPM
jgi:hypothetical protein